MTTKKTAQTAKFIQAAKENGCDESEQAFADKLKKIVKKDSKK